MTELIPIHENDSAIPAKKKARGVCKLSRLVVNDTEDIK